MALTLFELKLKITSAKDLKNVNWRHGSLKPYVSAWVEPNLKSSTKVESDGDTSPSWNETLQIPVSSSIDNSDLYLEIVHDRSDGEDDTEPVVGSARLSLRHVVDEVGFGVEAFRSLELCRPSGRPQGNIDVAVSVKDLQDTLHHSLDQFYAAPYSVTPEAYSANLSDSDSGSDSDSDFNCSRYRHAPTVYAYQKPSYGLQGSHVEAVVYTDEKKSGAGTEKVLDADAVAGAFDGLAIPESFDHSKDSIARSSARRNIEDEEEN